MTKKLTQQEFLLRCIAVHGDRYFYNKVKYDGEGKKVIIICSKHGEFEVTPSNFISRKSGCKQCHLNGFVSKSVSYKNPTTFHRKQKSI